MRPSPSGLPIPTSWLNSMENRPSWQLDMPILPIQGQSILPAIARLLVPQRAAQRLRYKLDHSNLVEVWGGVSERRRRLMSQAAKKPPFGDSIAS